MVTNKIYSAKLVLTNLKRINKYYWLSKNYNCFPIDNLNL